ncbi:Septum formation initiator [uncultured Eubacteriales bacterium]|uniref:Septum formation initiator n=1 Tax=uncultured Eubacteriales bacterium TaxID=172733 RepID=A0A212IYJ4_9FIRM|nr:Septum formation initiator [uncultured Eubacteriales bacterium]
MRTKKAGLATKLVVLALLIGLSITLLDMRAQLQNAQTQKEALETQVQAQTQVNADLNDAVQNKDDPQRQEDIARDALGLVKPGEIILKVTE